MVVDGHRENFLRGLLADDVFVEHRLDLVRLRQLVAAALGSLVELLADDVVAELDALVADEHRRAGDELAHLVLALAAERAIQQLAVVALAARIIAHSTSFLKPDRAGIMLGLIALVPGVCKAEYRSFADSPRLP